MPKPEKLRVEKRRKTLSKEFTAAIRSNNHYKLCEEAGIRTETMRDWMDGINKADIYDIRLHQIADNIKFPKDRMFV